MKAKPVTNIAIAIPHKYLNIPSQIASINKEVFRQAIADKPDLAFAYIN